MYELNPIYDTRQSFYGKAKIKKQKNKCESFKHLYSYGTHVARITCNYEEGYTLYENFGKYSQTTTRHQKEFFKQNGLCDSEIKDLLKKGELIKEWRD